MTKPHPMSEQCTARSKATGERCRRRVIGGGPCRKHGGGAPQVRRKREQRVLLGELAAKGGPVEQRTAAESLQAAARDADAVLQQIRRRSQEDTLDRASLGLLGEWLDRVSRLSKVVVEAKVDEAVVARENRVSADLAAQFVSVLSHAMTAARLTPGQKKRVDASVRRSLQALQSGELEPLTVAQVPTHTPKPPAPVIKPLLIPWVERKAITAVQPDVALTALLD